MARNIKQASKDSSSASVSAARVFFKLSDPFWISMIREQTYSHIYKDTIVSSLR